MRSSALLPAALVALLAASLPAGGSDAAASQQSSTAWFQTTEQALMDAVASGDKAVWEGVLDDSFVATSEEGELIPRAELLASLRGLPPGLSGAIAVRELSVQELGEVAVARFLADETEDVFGQHLATRYRITDVYRRRDGSWKLAASHTSVITADPPEQAVSKEAWPGYVGHYRLLPDGWTFTVELRGAELWGGRDPQRLRRLVAVAPNVFVVSGTLGEWTFVPGPGGKPDRLVDLRKFEVLVWSRLPD